MDTKLCSVKVRNSASSPYHELILVVSIQKSVDSIVGAL